ncbi:hypothetical protein J2T13_004058 [Paenibacillus sp. DS2015]|uniref:DUF6509 family protein n=1 Tax=Paenibacillus sp. DS2015 TaxID=3373917 RepID=UPI003D240DD1
MITVKSFQVEVMKDPFGILTGERYQFILDLDVEEDDELYSENGVYAKVTYKVENEEYSMIHYDLYEKMVDRYLSFDMEEDEEEVLASFCKANLPKFK